MVRLSLLALATSLAMTLALPQNVCTAVCRPEKPTCPEGEVAGGSEGCWGCCQPVTLESDATFCTDVCRPQKPECPVGQAPTGSEGCWGCCESIPKVSSPPVANSTVPEGESQNHICTLECKLEKPECPAYEAPTGSEGCWGCCQPIVITDPIVPPSGGSDDDMCLAVCQTEKPECPAGEAASGSEGCWGCCKPISSTSANTETAEANEKRQNICTAVCRPKKPVCPAGETATGVEGCWGCCVKM